MGKKKTKKDVLRSIDEVRKEYSGGEPPKTKKSGKIGEKTNEMLDKKAPSEPPIDFYS